jgi:hypothetical protein
MRATVTMRGIFAMLLAAATATSVAQTDERIVVPLTDAARPVTLNASLFRGSIVVTAHDRNEVVVVARETAGGDGDDEDEDEDEDFDTDRDDPEDAGRAQGLRRIPTTSLGMTVAERDNVVSIELDFAQRNYALEILVPRRTSVRASMVQGGDLKITGVTGEHELENVNGEILGVDIGGALVASTTNGKIQVSFTEVMPSKAMSFSTFNGDVDVTFPARLAAMLHINSGRGDVLTDFDVEVQPVQPSVVERGGDGERYRVRVERETRVAVGGGGPDMHFKTFNGDVTIRKR